MTSNYTPKQVSKKSYASKLRPRTTTATCIKDFCLKRMCSQSLSENYIMICDVHVSIL